MVLYYNTETIRTKQDLIDMIYEINAYRYLDGEDFDFGTGLIKNEMSLGSEDAYYEMNLQYLIELYLEYDLPVEKNKKKKYKTNKRYFVEKEKRDIERLSDITHHCVSNRGVWKKRCYRGSRSAHLKKTSNRKIRRYKGEFPKKGQACHKVFNFWWELY